MKNTATLTHPSAAASAYPRARSGLLRRVLRAAARVPRLLLADCDPRWLFWSSVLFGVALYLSQR